MNRYENFSPEIYELEESVASVEEAGIEPMAPPRQKKKPASRVVRREKKRKTESKTSDSAGLAATAATIRDGVKTWANGQTVRLLVGIFLGCFAAYLAVAFISYFATCVADQSEVNSLGIGQATAVRNAGGEGGARLSEFLINDTFGLGAVVIVIWLTAMCLKLLAGYPRFKSVNFTIKCMVALITLSLIVGLATIGVNSPVNWGGYHGVYVNEFVISFLGWTGAGLLCLFMVAAFVVICLRDVINWIIRIKKRNDERRARIAAEKEEQRRREEMRAADLSQERQDACAAGEFAADMTPEQETPDTPLSFEGAGEIPADDIDSYIYSEATPLTDEEAIAAEAESAGKEEETVVIATQPAAAPAVADSAASPEGDEDAPQPAVQAVAVSPEAVPEGADVMRLNRNTIAQSEAESMNEAKKDGPVYNLPPFDLLRPGKEKVSIDPAEQQANKELIEKTLLDFRIPIQSITATVGPTVTLYEIVPGTGVKISRICNLVNDIALSLSATGVRIIAPIPGRGTVGIEVANKERQLVAMRSVLQSKKFAESTYRLPIALGATISNDVFIADLAKMPHLLVAGATGQGKSVCLNAIIASLLYRKRPNELKFVMIDPKMVEFSLYNKIESHYLAKLPDADEAIITKMDNVVPTLSSLCVEMDNRYELLKAAHCRNLEEYNAKIAERRLNPEEGHRFLPYIVIIVDEFGDLIMTAGREVELPIARLAQKARAVGMHVIIATQRPSVKVITGIIKANFPARIAFRTTSGVDSKTILDTVGSEQLIGMGDMLVSNNSEMVRVQCAFIDTPEVEDLCDYVERQPFNAGCYILPEPEQTGDPDMGGGARGDISSIDPLLPEAARAVVSSNFGSTSSLQRRFSIGYTRAGKIMDQMENLGIVGPSHDGKPRSVLVDPSSLETILTSI